MLNLSTISGLLTAVVVLGILIFVHELGHFLVAKRLKFCVLKFSIGFGKKLFGFVRGETEYIISAIPLGGYVKFYGENMMGEEEDIELLSEEEKLRAADVAEERKFANIHPFKRILTVIAGPLFNLVFASLLFTVILMNGIVLPGTKVPDAEIGEVLEDHPASKAGVRAGDIILDIDGNTVEDWKDVHHFITTGESAMVNMKVKRGEKVLEFKIDPKIDTTTDQDGNKMSRRLVGIVNSHVSFGFGESLVFGAKKTIDYVWETIKGIGMLIMGEVSARDSMGGPIRIVQMTGEVAQQGILPLLFFVAIISISLGVINMIPIPILDGGAVIFFLVEFLKGSPVKMKVRMIAQQVGMFLLVSLMLFAIYNDIARIMNSDDEAGDEKATTQQTR